MSELNLVIEQSTDSPVGDVVLLHAFPCDGGLWQAQAAALAAAGYRVLVPDLPGFGLSPLPGDEPSLASVADVLLRHLSQAGVRRCILAGSSVGGYIAAAMLRAQPELIEALVMVGTKASADGDDARANRLRLAALVESTPAETGRILEQAVLPNLLGTTSWESRPEVVARVRAWALGAPADAVAWYQRAMAARPDSVVDLRGLAVPALVVWGPEDALSPRAEQQVMLDALPDGRLVEVPACGHLCSIECPDEVTTALLAFADQVTGPRPA